MGGRRAGEREQARRRDVEVRRAAIVANSGEETKQMIRERVQSLRGYQQVETVVSGSCVMFVVGYNQDGGEDDVDEANALSKEPRRN